MGTREFMFALLVSGFDAQDDRQVEAFYAHGFDDAAVEDRGDLSVVTFYREACSPDTALWSAIDQLRGALPACRVLRVDDQLVNATYVAQMTGRTSESIRQLAAGTRGPGGFPTPAGVVGKGVKVWRWAEVQAWLAAHGVDAGADTLPVEVVAEANAEFVRHPVAHPEPAAH